MSHYSMTCSCGDVMEMDANSRDEALLKLKSKMNSDAIKTHMMQRHPGSQIPTVAEIHAQITKNLQLVPALV